MHRRVRRRKLLLLIERPLRLVQRRALRFDGGLRGAEGVFASAEFGSIQIRRELSHLRLGRVALGAGLDSTPLWKSRRNRQVFGGAKIHPRPVSSRLWRARFGLPARRFPSDARPFLYRPFAPAPARDFFPIAPRRRLPTAAPVQTAVARLSPNHRARRPDW